MSAAYLSAALQAALADGYALERELGRGGMATVHQRPVRTRHARAGRTNQRVRPATSQVGTTFPSRQNFYFWNGRLPAAFSSGTSSRPRNPAYSTAGALSISGGIGVVP